MGDMPEMRVVSVPVLDTGLGREAGYASDAEMAAADEAARAEIEALLSPEALRLLKDAEDAFTRSVLGL
jgi:hypothetical protein